MNFNYMETLVAKAKNGDVSAKEIIFKEFRPMILNLSKRTFVHGYDFSDIEHECYATLLKCIKIYDNLFHKKIPRRSITFLGL